MRYLICGGAGFIGSHLAASLVARDHEVVVLDDVSTGSTVNTAALEGSPRFRLVVGSVLDADLVDELARPSDVIVHLAAAVGVRLIVDHPLRSLRTNIGGTEVVLDAAHRHDKLLFVASTSEVYGKNPGKMREGADHVLGPSTVARWSYASAKLIDEHLALAYHRELGTPVVVGRFFNTVGPRQMGVYGMVLTRFVAQALAGDELTIYGDGTQTRCFCHVSDTVRAVIGLVEEPRAVGEIFNIGSEEEVAIRDLAERVIAATSSAAGVRYLPYDEAFGPGYEDVSRRVPDMSKLKGLLGWEPAYDLDRIIKEQISYTQEVGPQTILGGRGG